MFLTFNKKKYLSLLGTGAVSLAVSAVLQVSDTVIGGNLIGPEAVSAISLITSLYAVVMFFSYLVTDGICIRYSEAVGRFDSVRAARIFSEGFYASVFQGALLFALTSLSRDAYLSIYGVSENIQRLSQDYLHFYRYVFALTPIYEYLSEMIYTEGDSSACILSCGTTLLCNIAVSLLMVKHAGIAGLGIGSLVGMILSILLLCTHFFKKNNGLRFVRFFSMRDMIDSARYSLLDASSYLFSALSVIFINSTVIRTLGEEMLPLAACAESFLLLCMPLDANGMALTPLVEVFRGEGNNMGESDIRLFSFNISSLQGILYTLLFFALSPVLPWLFGLNTPGLYDHAVSAFRILSVSALGLSLIYNLTSYYLILDRIMLSLVIYAFNSLLFPVGLSCLLMRFLPDVRCLWAAVSSAPYITLLFTLLYLRLRYKKDAVPFILASGQSNSYSVSLTLTEEGILRVRDELERQLRSRRVSSAVIQRILLLEEDALLLIMERNPSRPVFAELTLLFGPKLDFIIRDNGIPLDITDTDLNVSSLRSYTVSSFVKNLRDKNHLPTVNYNRNIFTF